jgi:O-antigen ligase
MKLRKTLNYLLHPEGATVLFISMVWASQLVVYLQAVFLRIPILDSIADFIVPFLYVVVLFLSLPNLLKNFKVIDFVFYFSCLGIYLLNFIFYPRNIEVLNFYWVRFLILSLPLYFIGIAIDIKKMFNIFFIISILCVFWQCFVSLIYKQATIGSMVENEIAEQMHTSYNILPHVLFVIWGTLRKFNIWGLIASVLGAFLIFSYGTRGPMLCMLLFIIAYLILFKQYKHRFLSWFLIIGVTAVLIYYLEVIVLFMQELTVNIGMSSRIFDIIVNQGLIQYTSGRDEIVSILINAIRESGFLGYGIGGSWQFVNTYPHNLVIDLWISFGLFFGSLLFIVIIFIQLRGLKACKTLEDKGFLMLLFFCGFFKLFMSYTYIDEPMLYMLLGFAVGLKRRKYQTKRLSNLQN